MIIIHVLPLIAALFAFVNGIRLLKRLRPGQICSENTDCNNCELLYALSIGSVILAIAYTILKIKWILIGQYPIQCLGLDLYAWASIGTAAFGLLSYLCRRGLSCMNEFCDFIR